MIWTQFNTLRFATIRLKWKTGFMLISMPMSHASVDLFVLSFVLPCAYAYVASENQALRVQSSMYIQSVSKKLYNLQNSLYNLQKSFFNSRKDQAFSFRMSPFL